MKYLLVLLVLLAGCSAALDSSVNPHALHDHSVSSEVEFVVEMIAHHQEAVDTSRLVLETTQNPRLAALAQDIIVEQEAEIALMNQWLVEYYGGGFAASYEPMMGDLSVLVGEERDVAYLEGMIAHHLGALDMARSVLELDPSSRVAVLANDIIESQSTELVVLNQLLWEY